MHTVYARTDRQQIVYSEGIGRRDVLQPVTQQAIQSNIAVSSEKKTVIVISTW